jgi:hypothetical protein
LGAFGILVERTDFRLVEVPLEIAGLASGLDGLRIVQVSDIHLGPFLSEREFSRAIGMANETRANLAIFTGDLITSTGDPVDACIRQIARLKADAGVFGCLGNHEAYTGIEDYVSSQSAKAGVTFLRGENRVLQFGGARVNLAGIDYRPLEARRNYLPDAQALRRPGMLNVLLSHNPDVIPTAAKNGFDVTLAGHTHGGQVTVEYFRRNLNIVRFLTPYVAGLYQCGSSLGYVNRGIGTLGLPMRLGAPPEITLFRLTRARAAHASVSITETLRKA